MKNRVFGFDLIRAVAVFLVVVGHGLGFVYAGTYSFFFSFLCGFLGVELFFVLSGVLIGGLLIKVFDEKDIGPPLRNFLMRRWWRTLPMYFLMLMVYYAGDRFFDSEITQNISLWKYLFFLQNFTAVQPTFFGVSWSLSIEEWFYVLFPATLFLIKTAVPKITTKKLFLISVLLFALVFLYLRIHQFEAGRYSFYEGARKIALLRLDAVAFGIFAVWLMHFYSEKVFKIKNRLLLLGVIILAVNQFIIFKDNYSHLRYFNTFFYTVLGFGMCLLFPYISHIKIPKPLLLKSITFLSKISYSLYLVHWLIFRFINTKYSAFLQWPLKFIAYLMLCFIAAALLYRFIEKPVLKYRERIYARKVS